jgi:rfaE bifunctional protein nucleotidyltransferase chain/domain
MNERHPDHRRKILTLDQLRQAAEQARRRGEKIILSNGCFDILHVGHVRYLEGAKALQGWLITAVNSDLSVRRLKGPHRPILPQEQRAELVAALRAVDAVILFDQPDVRQIIDAVRPDIHAKGTDYREDSVPERDAVIACGGTVRIVGDSKDHSTRDLLADIRRRCAGTSSDVHHPA